MPEIRPSIIACHEVRLRPMVVRAFVADDVLTSLATATPVWNAPSKAWNGGAPMADSSLNRRMTVRFGPGVAFAQIGICGSDGAVEFEVLRCYGPPLGRKPKPNAGSRPPIGSAEARWLSAPSRCCRHQARAAWCRGYED
ncbi:hypothetical protein ACFQS7_27230 [Dankookia sp. GCM10030260]|uniref:hypothetical protein n=1 Tax=Dankookia sp. GCM10030260 TaxID=3273390 RepID=UPI00360B90FE